MNDAQAAALIAEALPEVSERARLLVQIIGALESSYARGWKGAGVDSHNWGAIQGRYQGESFTYTDHHPNPDDPSSPLPYETEFRKYPDDASGIRDLWELLASRYPDAVDAAESDDWGNVSRALYNGGYYEGTSPDPEVNISRHRARTLELYRRIQPVAYPAPLLSSPPGKRPSSSAPGSLPYLLGAAAVLGAVVVTRRARG